VSDDAVDPRLSESKDHLAQFLARFCRGRELNQQLIHDVQEIADGFRTAARFDGIDFPEMVVLVMDKQNRVRLVRRDLDANGISNLVVELAQSQGKEYDPAEVARAIRRAFPHHRAADPRKAV
jgi:hypothetical protein